MIKKILAFTFLSFLLTSCGSSLTSQESISSSKAYDDEVQVVVLLGQSNAEGNSYQEYLPKTVGQEKADLYNEGFDNVKISYACTIANNTSNGEFVKVKTGQGYDIHKFGPEVGMAERFSEVDPVKPIYIIKYCYGGTTLSNNWRSPTSGNVGNLYTGSVNYIIEQCQKLESMGLYPLIKGICWMQGESDASGMGYSSYDILERNFINDIRKDLNYYRDPSQQIAFIDAGISDCVAWTEYQRVNNAKKSLAEEDSYHVYIDTIEAGLKYKGEPIYAPDIYHYDSSSEIKLGQMFAEELLKQFIEL